MPFSSGTFSLVAGNPVTTGTTISSTWANSTLSDIATGLSSAVLKDGTQTMTANIPMSGFKLTGLGAGSAVGDSVRYEQLFTTATGSLALTGGLFVAANVSVSGALNLGQAATITATATVAIGTMTGNYAVVTGTATVSSFDTIRAGALRIIEWSGLTPVSNSANMILPKGTSLVTVTGQSAIVVSEGGGTWRWLSLLPNKNPTRQVLTTGTGATYTTPVGATRINIRMVGGGGGGGGSAAAGTNGTASTWSGGSLSAGGGTASGAGGTSANGDLNLTGAAGNGTSASVANAEGAQGASSPFGGAGSAGFGNAGGAGQGGAAAANTGSGGGSGGAGGAVAPANVSGGTGGYLEKLITAPASTYTYTVGAAGSGGAGGANIAGGGNGGTGLILVDEFYD